jgi:4a-hydroxytetrahydrobiopterin dehydratase
MVQRISSRQFHATAGVDEWRVVFGGAKAHFSTGSFARGVEFVSAIGRLADAANHHPDIDLRYAGVTVKLVTHEIHDLSERDAALAARISAAARELGIRSDPSLIQTVQIAIDALDIAAVIPFWRAVLGYEQVGDEDLLEPLGRGPSIWFQQMDAARPQRNRIHIDVSVPKELAETRIEAALAAGGTVVNDANAPVWWTLADPEGNEVEVAPWADDAD